MRRFIISIVLVFFSCGWAAAESLVWKAQKGNAVIYLGGTCHILRENDYPLPPEFDRAYKAAAIVVFETDIGKMLSPETQLLLQSKALYADGSTVDKHLSARAYAKLSAYCTANNIPLQSLSRFRPSLLMTILTLLEVRKLGITERGVDQFFHELALKERKGVEGLETVEEQIDFVVSMADGNEDDFVSYSLEEMKTIKQQFEILAKAWRTGDAGKLDELMVAELKTQQPKLYKKLVTVRNRTWLPMIEGYLKSPQTRFVLVGAAHLVGQDGIIELLRKKGYKVEKL